jgi:hypothetical protein
MTGQSSTRSGMGIAAGGLIEQSIARDGHLTTDWDPVNTVVFNIQILNTDQFNQVTGMRAPEPPPDENVLSS